MVRDFFSVLYGPITLPKNTISWWPSYYGRIIVSIFVYAFFTQFQNSPCFLILKHGTGLEFTTLGYIMTSIFTRSLFMIYVPNKTPVRKFRWKCKKKSFMVGLPPPFFGPLFDKNCDSTHPIPRVCFWCKTFITGSSFILIKTQN